MVIGFLFICAFSLAVVQPYTASARPAASGSVMRLARSVAGLVSQPRSKRATVWHRASCGQNLLMLLPSIWKAGSLAGSGKTRVSNLWPPMVPATQEPGALLRSETLAILSVSSRSPSSLGWLAGDYDKRTASPCTVSPASCTFGFVTPHQWPAMEKWVAARKAKGVWRDIRVIDGPALSEWLIRGPTVAAWTCDQMGRSIDELGCRVWCSA